MRELPFDDGVFDLIWSEGAIYFMGLEAGLRAWRPLLAAGGRIAVSEMSWLSDERPQRVVSFWADAYAGMTTIAGNVQGLERAGYRLLETFVLSEAAWLEHFRAPLKRRVAELRAKYSADADALAVLDGEEAEIDFIVQDLHACSYVFYMAEAI